MKRRLALLAACSAAALMFGGAMPAFADNGPHKMGAGVLADGCAGCHRVHTAKTAQLTLQAQPALCYSCHGNGGAGADTDVQNGVGRGEMGGALRGGGFEYALIDSHNPTGQDNEVDVDQAIDGMVPPLTDGAATTSNHSVTGADAPAWGQGAVGTSATVQLRCGSCHDPHGNGNYRILRPLPEQADQGGTVAGVVIADAATDADKVYTTTNYWKTEDTKAPAFIANVSAWCSTCHTRYLAAPGDRNSESGDAVFNRRHTSNQGSQGGKNCITCHVSHGSNAAMGEFSGAVGNPDGSAAPGDSKLLRIDNRGTCKMCHQEGG